MAAPICISGREFTAFLNGRIEIESCYAGTRISIHTEDSSFYVANQILDVHPEMEAPLPPRVKEIVAMLEPKWCDQCGCPGDGCSCDLRDEFANFQAVK